MYKRTICIFGMHKHAQDLYKNNVLALYKLKANFGQ